MIQQSRIDSPNHPKLLVRSTFLTPHQNGASSTSRNGRNESEMVPKRMELVYPAAVHTIHVRKLHLFCSQSYAFPGERGLRQQLVLFPSLFYFGTPTCQSAYSPLSFAALGPTLHTNVYGELQESGIAASSLASNSSEIKWMAEELSGWLES